MQKRVSHKRLNRNSRGSIILPNNQRITPKEQRALRSAVARANRTRKRLVENLPKEAKERYKEFGVESDFVLRKKYARFNRFRNKKEFNQYLHNIKKITKKSYIQDIVSVYRENYNKAVDNVFNSAGQPIKDLINTLSDDELWELSLDESLETIGYVYNDPTAVEDKLKLLNREITTIRARKERTGKYGKRGQV